MTRHRGRRPGSRRVDLVPADLLTQVVAEVTDQVAVPRPPGLLLVSGGRAHLGEGGRQQLVERPGGRRAELLELLDQLRLAQAAAAPDGVPGVDEVGFQVGHDPVDQGCIAGGFIRSSSTRFCWTLCQAVGRSGSPRRMRSGRSGGGVYPGAGVASGGVPDGGVASGGVTSGEVTSSTVGLGAVRGAGVRSRRPERRYSAAPRTA